MSQYDFAFGPNGSYFMSTPLGWTSYGIPKKLQESLYADVESQNRTVSLGPGDEYFYGRTTPRQGNTWNTMKGDKGDTVVNWLNGLSATSGKEYICYGSGKSWIGCTANGAASWEGFPASFDQHIRGFHPVMVALGVDNSYVLVNGRGQIKWNLKGKYDTLDQILKNATNAIQMIAINPYCENQYIILFKTGTYRAMLPTIWRDTVAEKINAAQQHEAEVAKIVCQSMLDNQRQVNNFMMNMAYNMW